VAQEKRAHARIAVPLKAALVVGSRETELAVRDVSRGGIFVYTTSSPGVLGSQVTLKLSLEGGVKPVVVRGRIARVAHVPDGKGRTTEGVGIAFTGNDAATERALLEVIGRALVGRGTRNRAFPRIYYLLEVRCGSKGELKALMRDIGEGGLGLSVDQKLEIDEEVEVEISKHDAPGGLRLKGWVVSCDPAPDPTGRHRVGVRFGRQTPETRKELRAFISSLSTR
jgi:Tfp pilus assembly protein PilZ